LKKIIIDLQNEFLKKGNKKDIKNSYNIEQNIIKSLNPSDTIFLIVEQGYLKQQKYNAILNMKKNEERKNYFKETPEIFEKGDKLLFKNDISNDLIRYIYENKIKYHIIYKEFGTIRKYMDENVKSLYNNLEKQKNGKKIKELSYNNEIMKKKYKLLLDNIKNEDIEIMGGAMIECFQEELFKLYYYCHNNNLNIDFNFDEKKIYGKYDNETFSMLNKEWCEFKFLNKNKYINNEITLN
jgi:hypothetical protein